MTEVEFELPGKDHRRLQNLCGEMNRHLQLLEKDLDIRISNRGTLFSLKSDDTEQLKKARQILEAMYAQADIPLSAEQVHLLVREAQSSVHHHVKGNEILIQTRRGTIHGRGSNQQAYLRRIFEHDVNFGVGPAGTGKTYLAVAAAVAMLNEDNVRKIILVRPAVEAGERLGFLPGDLIQKVDPYLRPLYDALYEMLGAEKANKYLEKGIIEVAPLAFMRGRTLSDSFIILDEAQNTTVEQMKMFLTRIGFGSKAVVTGDLSQIDLPRGVASGLRDAVQVLQSVTGLSFTHFQSKDVVRHPLVQRIVEAYEAKEAKLNDAPLANARPDNNSIKG